MSELSGSEINKLIQQLLEIKRAQRELEEKESEIRAQLKPAVEYLGGYENEHIKLNIAAPAAKLVITDLAAVPTQFIKPEVDKALVAKEYKRTGQLPAGLTYQIDDSDPVMRVTVNWRQFELEAEMQKAAVSTKPKLKIIGSIDK